MKPNRRKAVAALKRIPVTAQRVIDRIDAQAAAGKNFTGSGPLRDGNKYKHLTCLTLQFETKSHKDALNLGSELIHMIFQYKKRIGSKRKIWIGLQTYEANK